MSAEKALFHCSYCNLTFASQTKTTWEQAKAGEYWFTAQGYIAKCPRCTSYADEIEIPRTRETECAYCKKIKAGILNTIDGLPCCDECWSAQFYKYVTEHDRQEESTIKVSYNGFAGELVKLEKNNT